MYVQTVWKLSHRLLQEQRHQQKVKLGHVRMFGQQSLEHRKPWEVAGFPVDLSYRGASASTATDIKA